MNLSLPPPLAFKQKPLAIMLVLAMLAPLGLTACGKKDATTTAGAGGAGAAAKMPPSVVNVMPVQFQSIPLITDLSGRTVAYQEATVTPQASGIIEQQLFREGNFVRQGQPLYRLNADNYTSAATSAAADLEKAKASEGSAVANVANAKANLKSAEVQQKLAEVKLNRLKALFSESEKAVSQQEIDVQLADLATKAAAVESARSNLAVAQAAVATANANVKGVQATIANSNLSLSRTTITAPMSGRASRPNVNVGALVTAGQTAIMTISRLDPIYVDISQSAAEMLALRQKMNNGQVGQGINEVQLKLADGSIYPIRGQVSFGEAKVDATTGTVALRAIFRNPDNVLLPGMFVNAQLIQGVIPNAVLLPQSAINRTAKGETTVYIVGADNKIQVRPVKVNGTHNGQWIVTEGLKQGENVVIIGGAKVKSDQQVEVKPYVASEDTVNNLSNKPTTAVSNAPTNSAMPSAPSSASPSATATTTTTTTTQKTVVVPTSAAKP